MNMEKKQFKSDHIRSYFTLEWKALFLVTVSGIIYNCGLLAFPYFEGQLAGCLMNVLAGNTTLKTMLRLVFWYVIIIIVVQGARYLKRFYVRRFANNVNRRMKKILYHNLLRKSKIALEHEGIGTLMTKAISDVDDCAEGMRKFTTEVFDTGVAIICYFLMLFHYDWKLSLLCLISPPIVLFIAEKMKSLIQKTGAKYKDQDGRLRAETLDMVENTITYRIFGCEKYCKNNYEKRLACYEKSAIKANIWTAALPPIYKVLSMSGIIFIFYFGSKNVLGYGWQPWDIAIFTTFLSCYTKLAVKSSKAGKLFNSVHKAQVSWKRIKPYMKQDNKEENAPEATSEILTIKDLVFSYPDSPKTSDSPDSKPLFEHISFTAKPGQIIGITGPVACGKSTLGKVFLCEYPYSGSIQYGTTELSNLSAPVRNSIIDYLGHDPELLDDSIKNNILMGKDDDVSTYLHLVSMDKEVSEMPDTINTHIGSNGIKLSGGQAQRLALARTLCHKTPVLILDDPFSALDRNTENTIFENLKKETKNSIVLLITHRLYLFPQFQNIIWMENGKTVVGSHNELIKKVPQYKEIYTSQVSKKAQTNLTQTNHTMKTKNKIKPQQSGGQPDEK